MANSSAGYEAISYICVMFTFRTPMAIRAVFSSLIKFEGANTSSNDTPVKM